MALNQGLTWYISGIVKSFLTVWACYVWGIAKGIYLCMCIYTYILLIVVLWRTLTNTILNLIFEKPEFQDKKIIILQCIHNSPKEKIHIFPNGQNKVSYKWIIIRVINDFSEPIGKQNGNKFQRNK